MALHNKVTHHAIAESDASVFEGMETRSLMGKGTHEEIVLPTDTVYLGSVFHNIASRAIHEYQPCTSGITAETGNGKSNETKCRKKSTDGGAGKHKHISKEKNSQLSVVSIRLTSTIGLSYMSHTHYRFHYNGSFRNYRLGQNYCCSMIRCYWKNCCCSRSCFHWKNYCCLMISCCWKNHCLCFLLSCCCYHYSCCCFSYYCC